MDRASIFVVRRILTCCLLCAFACCSMRQPEWVFLLANDNGTSFFIDPKAMAGQPASKLRVPIGIIPRKGSADYARVEDYLKGHAKDYRKYTHTTAVFEIDCEGKQVRMMSTTYWSGNRDALLANDYDPKTWTGFIPKSLGARILEVVCRDR